MLRCSTLCREHPRHRAPDEARKIPQAKVGAEAIAEGLIAPAALTLRLARFGRRRDDVLRVPGEPQDVKAATGAVRPVAPTAWTCTGTTCVQSANKNSGSTRCRPGASAPFYTDRERAALAWTEAVTLIAGDHMRHRRRHPRGRRLSCTRHRDRSTRCARIRVVL